MHRRWYADDPDHRGTADPIKPLNPLPAVDRVHDGKLKSDGYEPLARRPSGAVPGEMLPLEEANRRDEQTREWDDGDFGGTFGPYGW